MIHLTNLSKHYHETTALDNLTLSVNAGEQLYLIGKSGAGKSTLLKLLTGQELPSEGNIRVNSTDLSAVSTHSLIAYRRKIGIVFQDFKLLESKTIFENVSYRLEIQGLAPAQIKRSVLKLLDLVGLTEQANSIPRQLSGGEQQRVAIARAMITRPKLLLADEPTANLDSKNAFNIMEVFKNLNQNGTTILMATHNVEIVRRFPQRLVELENGKIIRDQQTTNYYKN